MNTLTRRIGVALTAALLATTAIAPMASAREWAGQWQNHYRQAPHEWQGERHRSDDGAGLALGLGLAALAGIAILSSANHAPQPVYQPAYPVYPSYPQPSYSQPAYAAPTYGQPICTTINGAAACVAPDGTWQYVR
jgi:hypothetical protein